MADPKQIAEQFVTQYYQLFDTNRAACCSLYHDQSRMIFEGSEVVGQQAIQEKLGSLSFQSVQHAVTTVDGTLSTDNGLVVFVNGQLKTDNDPPLPFAQTFYLKPNGESLFVDVDLFRLGVHNM